MNDPQILATLHRNKLRTLGDLDSWARVRRLSRWQALGVLVGVQAADRILGALAVRQLQQSPERRTA